MPIPQNDQTHSDNSLAVWWGIVWVCLTILWGWYLKGKALKACMLLWYFHYTKLQKNLIQAFQSNLLWVHKDTQDAKVKIQKDSKPLIKRLFDCTFLGCSYSYRAICFFTPTDALTPFADCIPLSSFPSCSLSLK